MIILEKMYFSVFFEFPDLQIPGFPDFWLAMNLGRQAPRWMILAKPDPCRGCMACQLPRQQRPPLLQPLWRTPAQWQWFSAPVTVQATKNKAATQPSSQLTRKTKTSQKQTSSQRAWRRANQRKPASQPRAGRRAKRTHGEAKGKPGEPRDARRSLFSIKQLSN